LLSYAYPLTDRLSLGANGKYIRQTLDSLTANAYAMDGGILYDTDLARAGAWGVPSRTWDPGEVRKRVGPSAVDATPGRQRPAHREKLFSYPLI